MIVPGVYRMSFRGLTLFECLRLGGPFRFPLALLLKVFGTKGSHVWLPAEDAEESCPREALGAAVLAALDPLAERAAELGFRRGEHRRATRQFHANIRDAGAYAALHEDGKRALFLSHVVSDLGGKTGVSLSFLTRGRTLVSIVNHADFLDDGGLTKRLVLLDAGLDFVVGRSAGELSSADASAVAFPDLAAFRAAARFPSEKAWEERIARGLFRKLPPEEEEAFLRENARE